MFSAWGYFLTRGWKNIRNHRLVSAASMGIVAASLLLFGIFLLLEMNLELVLSQVREQCEINVYLTESAEESEVREALSSIPGVKEIRYCSREERLQKVKETSYQGKETLLADFEEDNPLRNSYVLTIEDLEHSTEISEKVGKIAGVDEVTNLLDLANKIERFADGAEQAGFWLMLIFAFTAVFIISNTIRMGMAARSTEIEIMRCVGASGGYIQGPFLVEGILLGMVGACLSAALVLWGYSAALEAMQSLLQSDFIELVSVKKAAKTIIVSFLGLGMGIGLLGSGCSVHKYNR